jgi:phage FluMu gp28-like protein
VTPEERQEALELVSEIQKDRAGVKLADQPATRIPYILLPYQARWHQDTSTVRICEKGRRIGFTWGAWAAEAALEAARANGGMDQFYMGYNQGMAAEFIGDCAHFARWFNVICSDVDVGLQSVVIDDVKHDIVTYKIKFASGHKIEALSSMPHNWRGRQGHARIDEAGHHQNLGLVIDGAMAYRIWGGRISIGGTLNGEDNEFTDTLKRVKAKKLPWSHHSVRFSDAIREGLYERICLVTRKQYTPDGQALFIEDTRADYRSAEIADQELECIPLRGTGAYFSRLLLEKCAVADLQVLRFSKPAEFVLDPLRAQVTQAWIDETLAPVLASTLRPGVRTTLGQDFGRDGDLSSIVLGQPAKFGLGWRTPVRIELRRIPFDCQKQILFWLLRNVPLFHHIKLDARGNGQSHAEAARQEFGPTRVECVMLTPKWYDEWWPKYHQAYEDGDIQTFGDEDWISDHRSVVLINGAPRMSDARIKGSDGFDRHGDSAIAGLLFWAAANSDLQPSAGAYGTGDTGNPYRSDRGGGRTTVFGGRRAHDVRGRQRPDGPNASGSSPEGLDTFHKNSRKV